MLIEEYFQKIEAAIASCPYIFESRVLKDKRSLYIGVIQGEIYLIDESVLYFIEFVNVKEGGLDELRDWFSPQRRRGR